MEVEPGTQTPSHYQKRLWAQVKRCPDQQADGLLIHLNVGPKSGPTIFRETVLFGC